MTPIETQLLTPGERDAAVDTIASAFASDPAWKWMFETADDPAIRMRQVMTCIVDGGLLNNSVWRVNDCDSIAVWVPPGRSELTPQLEAKLAVFLSEAGGETTKRAFGLFAAFDRARAEEPPHHYLSMFATRPTMQGTGLGGVILRAQFEIADGESLPCYLESSNPTRNNELYEHLGFAVHEELDTPPGCPLVQSMWRAARP